jgi:hypothetical protein
MAAPVPAARRVLLAFSRDAADAARTLRWARAHVVRPDDRVTLVHVRSLSLLAPAATPVVELAVPLASLPGAWAPPGAAGEPGGGGSADALSAVDEELKALHAAAYTVDAVELRTVLRVSDALLTYLRFLPAAEKADALVMGSHGARYVGTALWKVPHASLDVAAGNTVCPLFLVRVTDEAAAAAAATGARFVVIALDGAAPSSSLLTRWAIANALRPTDTVVVVNKGASGDPM